MREAELGGGGGTCVSVEACGGSTVRLSGALEADGESSSDRVGGRMSSDRLVLTFTPFCSAVCAGVVVTLEMSAKLLPP